jgi:DNA ligase-1
MHSIHRCIQSTGLKFGRVFSFTPGTANVTSGNKGTYDPERYLKNKEKFNQKGREYRLKNPEKIKAKRIEKDTQKKKSIDPDYVRREYKNWKDEGSLKNFLDEAGESLGITDLSSWYRVSNDQITKLGGRSLFSNYPSLGFALKTAYPDYPWDMKNFYHRFKKADQRWLATLMGQILPDVTIIEDYRGHQGLKREETNRNCELDIWIEEYNLALEFQGKQHYEELNPGSLFRNLEDQQRRDIEKIEMCKKNGITLIPIPYWWDGTIESLLSTLHQYLPHLFNKTDSPPIPIQLPPDFKKSKRLSVKHLKEIMQGCDHEDENPTGYLMSEKLDGIRVYWDGKQFWSKNGSLINVPESFKAGLPAYALDGEFWSGYGKDDLNVNYLKQLCRKKSIVHPSEYGKIKFYVFDTPHVVAPYEKRHLFLQNNIPQYGNPNISLIPIQKCRGKKHLQNYLEEIILKKGEGIMLYNPDALYQPGRSKNVLKVKKYYECYVTFLKLWKKSYNLLCEQENGAQCLVKCSTQFYRNPPASGDKFLVRHLGFYDHSPPFKFKYPVLVEVEPVKPQNTNHFKSDKKTLKSNNNKNKKNNNNFLDSE